MAVLAVNSGTPSSRAMSSEMVRSLYIVAIWLPVPANFLWMLEDKSSRVRVTDLKIEALNSENPPKPRLKPHELPSGRWSFSCRVTSRYRKNGGG